jgi:PAS domain S-box-containing protein
MPEARKRLAFAAGVLGVAGLYLGAAKLGLALAFQAEQVTAVWPPTGIALAAVLLFGYRVWPGIALGAFLANATAHEPLVTACGIAVGNTLEALAGVWLIRRLVGFRNSVERLIDALALVVLAAVCSTMVSATIGVTSLCLGGVQPWTAYGSLWWLWWLGDAAGAVLVTPLPLTWGARWERRPRPQRATEAALLIGLLLLVSLVIFAGKINPGVSRHPLEYTIFPFIIWAALRFGQRGTTLVTFVASGIAIWGTVHGFGPFATGTPHENLILLQAFMAVVAITALLLSATITERRHAEKALRHSEEASRRQLQELEALYQTAPVGLSVLDSSLRYVRINENLAAINGVPVKDTLGRTLHEVIPEVAPVVEPVYRRVLETGEPVLGFEVHGGTPRGPGVERDWVVSCHALRGPSGSVVGVNCIVQEVTEWKQAELALKEADRRKNEFLATLAHELRNPLAPLRNALQLLQVAGDRPEILAQTRAMMERQLGHMVRLIDDLLDVSRITRNKFPLRTERIYLATVIQSALETTRPLLEELCHKLTASLPPEPIPLDADPVRLAQVFTNLLNNAAKFTAPGGHIALTALREDHEVRVSVRDTGIGIAPEHLPRLFTMFSQVTPALERSHGGLGIGLSLVRGLVELHGGSVEARSDGPGRGSTFLVRLPLAPLTVPEPPEQNGSGKLSGSASHSRILVVDDNRDSATSLGMMLQHVGHDIRTAHDGLEAVQAAEAFRPAVALLDIGLPKLNGYEVARQIRQQPWGKDLLLVAVSGWGQEEDKQRAREAGFDHHLTKPVELETLLELVALPSRPGKPDATLAS